MDDCARASERLTGALSDPTWRPSRAHIEGARNQLATAAAELERLTGLWKAAEAQEWRELQEARARIDRLEAALDEIAELVRQYRDAWRENIDRHDSEASHRDNWDGSDCNLQAFDRVMDAVLTLGESAALAGTEGP